jgi:DNA-binding NtrC family response regulator
VKRDATVLIVDDEANMRRVLSALLKRDGYRVIDAGDGESALASLTEQRVDVVLSDLKMPRMNGLELLEAARRRHPRVPIILLTAHGTIGSAVEAVKHGAFDYLTKPFDPDEIKQVVGKAVRTRTLEDADASFEPHDPDALLLGESAALLEVKRVTQMVAATPATVLISGESGTGKELVARRIHRLSDRSGQAFVKINCAAIPESLLESELFGHEKGAFTGAASRKPGRFELAHCGTLFLDEIGEMPLSAQPKLLRALQEGRFFRVGGTTTVSVDVRIVAATNRDLGVEVEAGRFREDLFYRLNVVPVQLPPLRERLEDLEALVAFFVERFATRQGRPATTFTPAALDALRAHSWPGNIRELENAIERAVLLTEGDRIDVGDLAPELREGGRPAKPACRSSDGGALKDRVRSATRRIEGEAIVEALELTHGNVTQAAKRLGLSRRGLQLKMRELGIERDGS